MFKRTTRLERARRLVKDIDRMEKRLADVLIRMPAVELRAFENEYVWGRESAAGNYCTVCGHLANKHVDGVCEVCVDANTDDPCICYMHTGNGAPHPTDPTPARGIAVPLHMTEEEAVARLQELAREQDCE